MRLDETGVMEMANMNGTLGLTNVVPANIRYVDNSILWMFNQDDLGPANYNGAVTVMHQSKKKNFTDPEHSCLQVGSDFPLPTLNTSDILE